MRASRHHPLGADDTAFGGDQDFEHGKRFASQGNPAALAVDLANLETLKEEHGEAYHQPMLLVAFWMAPSGYSGAEIASDTTK